MNLTKFTTLCLLTAALSGCAPPGSGRLFRTKEDSKPKSDYTTIRLGVSDHGTLGSGFAIFSVKYNGMPNYTTFSVSAITNDGTNYYYPATNQKIHYEKQDLDVLKVTPDSLILGYQNKK